LAADSAAAALVAGDLEEEALAEVFAAADSAVEDLAVGLVPVRAVSAEAGWVAAGLEVIASAEAALAEAVLEVAASLAVPVSAAVV
jgi:hypothetical protein